MKKYTIYFIVAIMLVQTLFFVQSANAIKNTATVDNQIHVNKDNFEDYFVLNDNSNDEPVSPNGETCTYENGILTLTTEAQTDADGVVIPGTNHQVGNATLKSSKINMSYSFHLKGRVNLGDRST